MKGLLMYLVLAGIGYFTGSRLKKQTVLLCLADRVQTAAAVILLAMGMRILIFPLFVMAGAFLAALLCAALLGFSPKR